MIIVVTKTWQHPLLPQRLSYLRDLFLKACGNAFENLESIDRFVDGLNRWLKEHYLKGRYAVFHHSGEGSGSVEVVRPLHPGWRHVDHAAAEGRHTVMLSMTYLIPRGHVCVSKDGEQLYLMEFFNDEREE